MNGIEKCCGMKPIPWVVTMKGETYHEFEFEFSSLTDACDFIEKANAHSVKKMEFKLCQKVESEGTENESV